MKFNIQVSYFVKGELKKIRHEITASSAMLAWRTGLGLIPMGSANQVQIKVDPIK